MLDKKALRKFAADNPAPAIPLNHGLLHTPQVRHIIRTAVRLIARMAPLHALPRGLNGWVRREVMPVYFRCEHTKVEALWFTFL